MSTLFNRQPSNQFFTNSSTFGFGNQQQQQQPLQFAQQQVPQQPLQQPQQQQQQLLQQQQQQQQQQLLQQQQQNNQPQLIGSQNPQEQPTWLQSQHNHKKRIIPNHLIPHKKTAFHINAPNSSKSGNKKSQNANSSVLVSNEQFNIVSFGSNNKHNSLGHGSLLDKNNTSLSALFDSVGGDLSRFDETLNDSFHQLQDDDGGANSGASTIAGSGIVTDLPPLRSIYDLNEERFSSKPERDTLSNVANKAPQEFKNLFNRNDNLVDNSKKKNNNNNNKDFDQTDEKNTPVDFDNDTETSIIVFGYPENSVSQIIQFFKQFGTILEKFTDFSLEGRDGAKSLLTIEKQRRNVPIFTGPGWIKITYDNTNSALNALQENGSIFSGNLLGVVPFHKSVIEKLEKNKAFLNEDIGNGNLSTPLHQIYNEKQKNGADSVRATGIITPPASSAFSNSSSSSSSETRFASSSSSSASGMNKSSYVDVKEGSRFFINPDEKKSNKKDGDANKPKLGLVGSISKYLFGFHDL